MDHLHLILNLALAIAAAALGGGVAHRLGQPVIVGYMVGGVLVGPYTPGPVADTETVRVLAELGVALLMFTVGVEMSLREIWRLGATTGALGAGQILLTIGLGGLVGPSLGLAPLSGVFLGAIIALCSSTVLVKVLGARGELGSVHGRLAVGVSVVQDLSLIPLTILLPVLAASADASAGELPLAFARTAVLLGVTLFLGPRVVPFVLERIAASGSRELFLLAVIAIALATALFAAALGLGLALGAFLGGLVVSESELGHQALSDILPVRDIFASLFFASVGMLVDPSFLLANLWLLLAVVALVILGKGLITIGLALALRLPPRPAIMGSLALAQVGELSFVLAQRGVDTGAISDRLYGLTLSAAMVTILANPLLLRSAGPLQAALTTLPFLGRLLKEPASAFPDPLPPLRRHAVVCGYGRVGGELVDALTRRGFACLVVEYDSRRASLLRERGLPWIYGDSANPAVLQQAGLDRAQVLALAMPDVRSAELAARHARALNPRLDIVARAQSGDDVPRLRAAGVDEVVHPEFEAGLEFVRHALLRYGVSSREIDYLVAGRRMAHYRPDKALLG